MRTLFLVIFCVMVSPVFAKKSFVMLPNIDLEQKNIFKVYIPKFKDASTIINEQIVLNYVNRWSCGTFSDVLQLTPDQALKFNYNRGLIHIVGSFTATNPIVSYTPIRQLANRPERPALFEGHYYLSE